MNAKTLAVAFADMTAGASSELTPVKVEEDVAKNQLDARTTSVPVTAQAHKNARRTNNGQRAKLDCQPSAARRSSSASTRASNVSGARRGGNLRNAASTNCSRASRDLFGSFIEKPAIRRR